jgi:hypothetical protein
MCTELFLALLYFVTIFSVNFLLSTVLRSYLKKLSFYWKFKNLSSFFKTRKPSLVSCFLYFSKEETVPQKYLTLFPSLSETQDVLIIGGTYRYLRKNQKLLADKKTNYYLLLLEKQYSY